MQAEMVKLFKWECILFTNKTKMSHIMAVKNHENLMKKKIKNKKYALFDLKIQYIRLWHKWKFLC
jgi:hypothetical protein